MVKKKGEGRADSLGESWSGRKLDCQGNDNVCAGGTKGLARNLSSEKGGGGGGGGCRTKKERAEIV